MTELIKAVEATAAPSGRGLDVVASAAGDVMAGGGRAQARAEPPEHAATLDEVRAAFSDVTDQLRNAGVDLTYRVDPDLHRVIVEVVDRQDGTVLRQIPGEEALRLARAMQNGQGGLLQTIV
ncbi:flagellar protein FlaG [Solimonas marina]|uniref:Flagellar protein FlaG n=1 Tax=Solimonas marina TaxID=2714601 RepID=A0A970B8V4_9GAMM|nr:flagellar protein FlaG [Solimonas marina]NKF21771.1 flagellar protein FlaG [Solimonas marina]